MLFTIGLDPGKYEERNCLSSIKEPNWDVKRKILKYFVLLITSWAQQTQQGKKFLED